jgi:hypothetical protein
MKLRWSDLWARLWPGKKSQGPVGPPDRAWFSWGWGASTPQVVALAVAVVLFGGLAVDRHPRGQILQRVWGDDGQIRQVDVALQARLAWSPELIVAVESRMKSDGGGGGEARRRWAAAVART